MVYHLFQVQSNVLKVSMMILKTHPKKVKTKSIPFLDFIWCCVKPKFSTTEIRFTFGYVAKVFIVKELCSLKLNKATGKDGLPPGKLKDSAKYILKQLSHISSKHI